MTMTPTLHTFIQALQTPDISFTTLADARPATEAGGIPQLMRTTRFAEAEIVWHGRQWLLSLPLSPAALAAVERTASQAGRLNTEWLAEYRILRGELLWVDAEEHPQTCDLVLQHLPAGRSFAEALLTEPAERLLAGLDALRSALRELGFSHNNLRPDNLRWSGGRFIPLRYHDARFGTSDGDAEAFEALRRRVREAGGPMQVSDIEADYAPLRRLTGHRWTSHVFEGLVCVEDDEGFGFVDTDNNPVIASHFVWAGDFREGRAEVETPGGMGLIDRNGNYVIPPEYEIVDYIPAESIARVRRNGRWAEFDYLGQQLTEFGTNREENATSASQAYSG